MARVIKCDRCGELFEYHAGDINGIALLNVTKNKCYINRDKYDLCPDCWKSWKDWFKRGKAQEKGESKMKVKRTETIEADSVKRWKPMKKRKNRVAFQGKEGTPELYWLMNRSEVSVSHFAVSDMCGDALYYIARDFIGVRPVFCLR